MRRAASVGYLLARASDSLADAHGADLVERLGALDRFRVCLDGEMGAGDFRAWSRMAQTPAEARLLEGLDRVFGFLSALPDAEAGLVREVVGIIVGGQRGDLTRFGAAGSESPVVLADAAELEDYAWRVAGCVGEFWTRLGFLTMGSGFSLADGGDLLARGREYGKGLQLVNILRDLPEDLAAGRCYLPVSDPRDEEQLMVARSRWVVRAADCLRCGEGYARDLLPLRLRLASALPARIGLETLALVESAGVVSLRSRVKVSRSRVRGIFLKALWDLR